MERSGGRRGEPPSILASTTVQALVVQSWQWQIGNSRLIKSKLFDFPLPVFWPGGYLFSTIDTDGREDQDEVCSGARNAEQQPPTCHEARGSRMRGKAYPCITLS